MSDRTYARLYYPEFIRDYPDVWSDDRLLSAWLRLFIRAEQMWPLPVDLPRSVRPRSLAYLVERGLIVVTGETYVVKGMEAERTRRSNAGKAGAAKRWQSDGNANASPTAMPSKDETRRDEITPPPPLPVGRRKNGTNPRATGTNPRAQGTSIRQERQAKKTGPVRLHDILRAAAAAGSE